MHTLARRRRPLSAAALLVGTVMTLAACSSGGSSDVLPSKTIGGTPLPGTAVTTSAPTTAAGAATTGAATAGSGGAATGSAGPSGAATATVSPSARQALSVLGVPRGPGCDPVLFVTRAGAAGGALSAYVLAPEGKGALSGSGTAHAVALLHAGQAVRFSAAQLTAARGTILACPAVVAPLIKAVDGEIAELRVASASFARNTLPGSAVFAALRKDQAATVAEARKTKIVVVDVVPTAIQIQSS